MTLYVESSAILAWILEEPAGWRAFDEMRDEEHVITSELTLIECDRALHRYVVNGWLEASTAQGLRTELIEVSSAWDVTPIGPDVVDRARASFPDDRMRALDAIHLASAMAARANLGPIDLLTLDDRIRATGLALGFRVRPA